MEHYLIFKSVNTLDLGLHMAEALPKVSPSPRYTNITVPGRDGTLTSWDGTYDVMSSTANFTVNDLTYLSEICALFKGSGDLISSLELEKKYSAKVKTQGDFSRIIRQWHKFDVEFELQPFQKEVNPQTVTLTGPGVLYNIGTLEAKPIIKVFGSGDITLTVNGKDFIVKGSAGSAVIDSENYLAYSGSALLVTAGEFPRLPAGKSTISFSGASKIEITPNWRWI